MSTTPFNPDAAQHLATEGILDPEAIAPVPAVSVSESQYKQLYEAQKLETERANALLTAARSTTAVAPQTIRPAMTADRVKATLGDLAVYKLTRDQKLQSLGIDPASITDQALSQLFGRGNDGKLGADLVKSNPRQYFLLREAAMLLNLYCS